MRGEELHEAYVGFPGIYGDRLYAFRSSAAPKGFPYLTGREQEEMLLYRPGYRYPEHMSKPANLAEAEAIAPGLTPVYAEATALMVDVETPAGKKLAIDDHELIDTLRQGIRDRHELTLLRSDRAMTDCRPISLFSVQTVRQLSEELEGPIWTSGVSNIFRHLIPRAFLHGVQLRNVSQHRCGPQKLHPSLTQRFPRANTHDGVRRERRRVSRAWSRGRAPDRGPKSAGGFPSPRTKYCTIPGTFGVAICRVQCDPSVKPIKESNRRSF